MYNFCSILVERQANKHQSYTDSKTISLGGNKFLAVIKRGFNRSRVFSALSLVERSRSHL